MRHLAEFRSDIETFVSFDVVKGCVGDYVEMAPLARNRYFGFVDPSGGSIDSFTMAIAHRDGERVVIDAIREVTPPFSPDAVIADFSMLLKSYRVTKVQGDRYGGEFPREVFRKHGIEYRCAEKPKSDLFRDLLSLLNSGQILLPKSERLVNQIVGLERRVARGGRDSIDHSPGAHDDIANSVAGAAALVATDTQRGTFTWGTIDPSGKITWSDQRGRVTAFDPAKNECIPTGEHARKIRRITSFVRT